MKLEDAQNTLKELGLEWKYIDLTALSPDKNKLNKTFEYLLLVNKNRIIT